MMDTTAEVYSYSLAEICASTVNKILAVEKTDPTTLIIEFKTDPFLKRQFERDSGVFEGYTLEKHTVMVLGQFEKYFSAKPLPGGVTRAFFRAFLALHDIGKPLAVLSGDKKAQHAISARILPVVFKALGFAEDAVRLALALVAGDPIGRYLRGKMASGEAGRLIQEQAAGSGQPLDEFFSLLTIYYLCDAGSYTADAGGIPSLDRLFRFDHQNARLSFAPNVADRFEILKRETLKV